MIGIVDTGVPAGQQVVAEDRLTRLRAIYRGGGFLNLHERVYLEPVSGDRTYRGTGQGNHGLIVTCFAGGNTESKYGPKRGVAWHNRIMSVDIDLGGKRRK